MQARISGVSKKIISAIGTPEKKGRTKGAPHRLVIRIPTLALPKSGLRVEADSLLSAGWIPAPRIGNDAIIAHGKKECKGNEKIDLKYEKWYTVLIETKREIYRWESERGKQDAREEKMQNRLSW